MNIDNNKTFVIDNVTLYSGPGYVIKLRVHSDMS